MCVIDFFFYGYGDHRDLHVLTHSCPTRRAADLSARPGKARAGSRRSPGSSRCRHGSRCRCSLIISRSSSGSSMSTCPSWCSRSTPRSEEHTSELQSLMRISYAVFCLKKKKKTNVIQQTESHKKQI